MFFKMKTIIVSYSFLNNKFNKSKFKIKHILIIMLSFTIQINVISFKESFPHNYILRGSFQI